MPSDRPTVAPGLWSVEHKKDGFVFVPLDEDAKQYAADHGGEDIYARVCVYRRMEDETTETNKETRGDGPVVDLKTVAAMPSGIATVKRAHIRQVSCYQLNVAKPAALLYISRPPKSKATHNGVRWIELEDDYRTAALADLRRAAKAVMAAAKMDDADLRAIMSPDFDSYYWNSITKAKALEVWP